MKLVFLAFTSKEYDGSGIKISNALLTRKMSCMETWVPKIEALGHKVIFFGGDSDSVSYSEPDRLLRLTQSESYDHNPPIPAQKKSFMFERLKAAISWVLENEEFDYVFRTDDGSYINHYVLDDIIGTLDNGNIDVLKSNGGGAGLFLSKKVCQKLIEYNNEKQVIEDLALFQFIDQGNFITKTSNLLCMQYILGEKLFTIHYTNGKRQYFVDNILNYYFNQAPIKRKVIIDSDINYGNNLLIKTWGENRDSTPMWYSFDKDKYNWEFYGKQIRSYYCFQNFCPFGIKSIHKLIILDNSILINNKNIIQDYVDAIQDGGQLIINYDEQLKDHLNNLDTGLSMVNNDTIDEISEFFKFDKHKWIIMERNHI